MGPQRPRSNSGRELTDEVKTENVKILVGKWLEIDHAVGYITLEVYIMTLKYT